MKVIGLTGGIGAGKSTAAAYLAERGCVVIDADGLARDMTRPGGEALPQIRESFGDGFFFTDGSLDRKKLGAFVFGNDDGKRLLETIVTEKVISLIKEKTEALKRAENAPAAERAPAGAGAYAAESIAAGQQTAAVIDAPLLFECGLDSACDESWLITAGRGERLSRVIKRDGLPERDVLARMEAQMSEEEKKKRSSVIIYNDGDLARLYEQLETNLERLKDER